MKIRPFYLEKTLFPYKNDNQPYTINLKTGNYFIECVGASGGGGDLGGRGAKVSAFLSLKNEKTLYIYVGREGGIGKKDGNVVAGGFNGGGNGGSGCDLTTQYAKSGSSGGGATDIRLKNGNWDDQNSLKSRVLVAGGGGGASFGLAGGHAGKIKGLCSGNRDQLTSYFGGTENDNVFGHGQNGANGVDPDSDRGAEGKGGGGGGYYGGLASQGQESFSNAAGGGGSSYVSGDVGFTSSTELIFTNANILDGSEHTYKGNGYAIISEIIPFTIKKSFSLPSALFFIYFFLI